MAMDHSTRQASIVSVIALWLGHEHVENHTDLSRSDTCHEGESACQDLPARLNTGALQTGDRLLAFPEQLVEDTRLCRAIR